MPWCTTLHQCSIQHTFQQFGARKIACAACICIIWAFCCSICLSTMLCQTQQRNFQTQRLVMPAHRRTQVPISVSVSSESSSSVPISEFFLGSFALSLNLNIISLIIFIYPHILIYLIISQYILIYLNWCICISSEHVWILCFSPSLVSPVSRPLLVLVLLFQLSNLVLELTPGVSRNQYFSYQPGTWHIHFKNACFGWMITNLHIKNGCLTKHPLETGCLGFQEGMLKKNPWMTICGCADIYLWFPGSCGFMVAANCAPKILSSQVATPHKLEGSESLFKQLSGSFPATSRNIWKNHEKSDKSASSALVAQVVCKTFDVFSEPKESSTISNV